MTFAIHTWTAADGAELRYGVIHSDSTEHTPNRGLVFVPGLGGSVKNSLVFFNALLHYFNPIVVPDLRGFGLNEGATLPHPQQFVADLNALVQSEVPDHLLQRPWTLGGISLGSCVISHWLGQQTVPALCDSAWLLAPAVQENPQAFQLSYVLKTLWTMATAPHHLVKLPYGLDSLTQNPAVLSSQQHQQHMKDFRLPAEFLWQLRGFNRSSVSALQQVRQPVHCSIPLADKIICPKAMLKAFHSLRPHPQHQYHTYPGLYHDVPLELGLRDVVMDVGMWAQSLQ